METMQIVEVYLYSNSKFQNIQLGSYNFNLKNFFLKDYWYLNSIILQSMFLLRNLKGQAKKLNAFSDLPFKVYIFFLWEETSLI